MDAVVQNFKRYDSGSMLGFFDLALSGGVVVTGCKAFRKEDKLWFAWTAEKKEGKDGTDQWRDIVTAAEPTMRHLQALICPQLRALVSGNAGGAQPRQSNGGSKAGEHGDRDYQESRRAAQADLGGLPF